MILIVFGENDCINTCNMYGIAEKIRSAVFLKVTELKIFIKLPEDIKAKHTNCIIENNGNVFPEF